MTRTMFDSITPGNIPASASMVAGYVDGLYANIPAMRARFPHATVVEITVFARDDAGQVLDVENGDASPSEAPGWVQRRRAAGVDPTVYCNDSTWPAVRAAFAAAGVAQPHYWVALYDGDPTIPAGAVAKQYRDAGPYDLSSVADYWPGVDSTQEVPVTLAEMKQLISMLLGEPLGKGSTTVGEALQSMPQYVWDHTEVDAATGKPIRMGALMGWLDRMRELQTDGINSGVAEVTAKVEALTQSVAALAAKVDSIVAAGGPTGAAVQAAVQAAMQAEFAAAGKALEGAVAPPAPAPKGSA